jgi:hypothetical protein
MSKRLPHYGMEQFRDKVWAQLYQNLLMPETKRRWSFSAESNLTTLRIYELAGRLILTFQRQGEDVTYITTDDDAEGNRFGLQSYNGTMWNHHEAFADMVRGWESHQIGLFKYDKKQRIA